MNPNKNINSRNMMNDKMHNFITPNYLNGNNQEMNTFQNKPIIYEKNSSKNDINSRFFDSLEH